MLKKNILLICLLSLFSVNLYSMQISPIKIYIDKYKKVSNVNIKNTSKTTKTYQASVYKWNVIENGKFVLNKTKPTDIIAIPMIFKLKPNELKSIKIGKMKINKLENYRILIKDITPNKKQGIAIRMATSIPIFVLNENLKPNQFNIENHYVKNNKEIIIKLKNNSNSFIEIKDIIINDEIIIKKHLYLLAKHKLNIKIPLGKVEYKKYKVEFLNGLSTKEKEIK